MRGVALHLRVCPHGIVHGGTDNDRSFGREQNRAQQIVGASGCGPCEEIGGCRRDADDVAMARQLDVIEGMAGSDQVGVHRLADHGFEGDGPDEFARRRCEDHIDRRAELGQVTGDLHALVSCDAARYPEQNVASLPGTPGSERRYRAPLTHGLGCMPRRRRLVSV